MADIEFLESDVVFSDNHNNNHPRFSELDSSFDCHREVAVASPQQNLPAVRWGKSVVASGCGGKKKTVASSVPVNIPQGMVRLSEDSDEDEDEGKEMVPPHVITGRRLAGKMAFSVCTGQGRTLKGRDLSQVRNSILRMTGFLEA